MTDATVQMIVIGSIGLLLLSGFIYMFDDFFGSKKKSARKSNIDVKETEQI